VDKHSIAATFCNQEELLRWLSAYGGAAVAELCAEAFSAHSLYDDHTARTGRATQERTNRGRRRMTEAKHRESCQNRER